MKLSSTERALVLLMLIESRNDSDMERLLLSYLLIKAFENDSSDDDTSSDSEVSDTDEEEPVVRRKVAAPSRVQTNGAQKSYVRAAPKRKTPQQSSSKVAQKRRRVTEMVTCATSKSGAEDGTTSDSSLLSEDPLATVKIERESDDETSQNHYIKIEPVESHLVDNLCVNESDLQHAQSANEIKDEIEIKDELLNM